MYYETPLKILAVWYRAELSNDDTALGAVLARMVSEVETDQEIDRSGRKTLPSIVVLVEDPQFIK